VISAAAALASAAARDGCAPCQADDAARYSRRPRSSPPTVSSAARAHAAAAASCRRARCPLGHPVEGGDHLLVRPVGGGREVPGAPVGVPDQASASARWTARRCALVAAR
jgi:hypothetical protein